MGILRLFYNRNAHIFGWFQAIEKPAYQHAIAVSHLHSATIVRVRPMADI
jgi:hypothetical protein